MMQAIKPRRSSILTSAAVAVAALMLLLTVRSASAAPVISAVTPNSGPASGGTEVTITGSGFADDDDIEVLIGGNAAEILSVNVAGTSVVVSTPEGDVGPADVTVHNITDDDTTTLQNGFTYLADPPFVIGVAPDTSPAGAEVRIFGTGFSDGAEVLFGDTAATDVVVDSENQITATAPAGTGTVDVTVTNPDDQESTLADAFTYGAAPGDFEPGEIVSGSIPSGGGFGLFVFSGGTNAQLVTASGCPQATVTFYATNAQGGFVTYIPGSGVQAVNAAWNALFAGGIPELTALIGKCA